MSKYYLNDNSVTVCVSILIVHTLFCNVAVPCKRQLCDCFCFDSDLLHFAILQYLPNDYVATVGIPSAARGPRPEGEAQVCRLLSSKVAAPTEGVPS